MLHLALLCPMSSVMQIMACVVRLLVHDLLHLHPLPLLFITDESPPSPGSYAGTRTRVRHPYTLAVAGQLRARERERERDM
ncbi:hypothetical protein IWX91DRAFT_350391 [Phyllosticta citricarpa]